MDSSQHRGLEKKLSTGSAQPARVGNQRYDLLGRLDLYRLTGIHRELRPVLFYGQGLNKEDTLSMLICQANPHLGPRGLGRLDDYRALGDSQGDFVALAESSMSWLSRRE